MSKSDVQNFRSGFREKKINFRRSLQTKDKPKTFSTTGTALPSFWWMTRKAFMIGETRPRALRTLVDDHFSPSDLRRVTKGDTDDHGIF